MNVNAYLDTKAIREIEAAVDWYSQINVQPALNAQRMKNVKRMNALEQWNVDQLVRMLTVARTRSVYQTITLPSVNARLDHGLEIHTI